MNAQVHTTQITMTHDLVSIQQELKAPKDKFNSFGKYHYRSCESILEAVKPLLKKYNCSLVLLDESKELCGIPVITAIAKFTDSKGNETIVQAEAGVEVNKKGMDIAQTFGASSSYARKYALNGLFLIDDSKDPDSDEFHNQTKANNQPTNNQKTNAPPLNTQQAFRDIQNANNKNVLITIWNTFKGTPYEQQIQASIKAKRDQMGW
ncbi:ERF family protein [Acinetobacter equi]|uniref:Essential recombination function protein n=1 Tax=Acinetobacter equi TaxID=1324350 RepID=A0A0N9W3Q1_9GAMM|nr:ERF family protein [Acinetobacter equi]ALH95684.1 Essential recombination function protein [Acinetobacter equi]